jgi:hypothetical protein
VKHYGYKPTNIKLLLGAASTSKAIRSNLGGEFLGNKSRVQKTDSVLVFFAGHGHRLPLGGGPVGAISPSDVQVPEQGQVPAYDSVLSYKNDVLPLLQNCPARHKLLILNCCHAGEVFTERLFPLSTVEDRRQPSLFGMDAFQALASSRANEVDSDGEGGNSPFTASLVHAFRMLPVHRDRKLYFTASELFSYMVGDFTQRRRREQSPSLRSLIKEDGEFRFYPDPETNFDQYREKDINIELLRAMVPGVYGNWWFDETPWFIPSLRMAILAKRDLARGPYLDAIRREELLKAARRIKKQLKDKPDNNLLSELRLVQLQALLAPSKDQDVRKQREELIAELSKRQGLLEATDVHLMAVLQHSLGKPDAERSYELALDKYRAGRAEQKGVARQGDYKALEALCLADYGYYKFSELNECSEAAKIFAEAGSSFEPLEAPPPFQIFLLCREADALQRLGRWGLALKRLEQARFYADRIDPDQKSSLTAHAMSRLGWAFMEQWKFKKAIAEFNRSEDILRNLLREDPNALVLSYHNRHGKAMAKRFQGNVTQAAADYRELVNDLAEWFNDARQSTTASQDMSEVQDRLRERWFNSMERLVDCNLFAGPGQRDLREASDDLRRTIRYCYVIPGDQGKLTEAGLMYKQAIVLSLRSPAQDIPLAVSYCKRAETLAGNQGGLLDFQRKLAPPIVNLFKTCADKPDCLESKRAALAKLRGAVEELREKWKYNDHRDYLEFLMFASKILVDEAIDADRYETLADSEMLLGFCRRALRGGSGESLPYLRPYYDAVMETKLRLRPKHAKELLEVQWEATRGRIFRKESQPIPVIALYHLKDRPYLLLDIPGGASNYYCLEGDYSGDEIHKALASGSEQLDLPREVVKELQKIPSAGSGERCLQCWSDGDAGSLTVRTAGFRGAVQGQQFPFKLPRGFKVLPAGPRSQLSVTRNQ